MTDFLCFLLLTLTNWIFAFVFFQFGKMIAEDEWVDEYNEIVRKHNDQVDQNDLLQEENTKLRKELERIRFYLNQI